MAKDDIGFNTGIEYRDVRSGVEWWFKRDDGSCVKGWAPTRDKAEKQVKEEMVV